MLFSLPILADYMPENIVEADLTSDAGLLSGLRFGPQGKEPATAYLEQRGLEVLCRAENDCIRFGNCQVADIYNQIAEIADRLATWQEELDECIHNDGELKDIVDCCRPYLDNPIFIVDRREVVFAMSDDPPGSVDPEWDYMLENGRMPYGQVNAIYHDKAFYSVLRSGEYDGKPFVFQPPDMIHRSIIFRIPDPNSEAFIGTFVIIENDRELTQGVLHLAKIPSRALKRWVGLHEDDHKMKSINDFLVDLICERPVDVEEIELQKSLHRYGGKSFCLAIIPLQPELEMHFLGPVLEKEIYGSLSFEFDKHLLLLCTTDEPFDEILEKLETMARELSVRVGISYPFSNLQTIRVAYRQALIALQHSSDSVSGLDPGSAMRYLVTELSDLLKGSEITHPALGVLREHDKLHDSQYYETLFSYLRHERNLVKTAASLFIHRNSLVYRIARINELIQVDLDEYDVRLYLMLSYLCRDCQNDAWNMQKPGAPHPGSSKLEEV